MGAAAAASADWPLDRIYGVFPMLARRRGQRASTLSGGEQQAVAIARALAAPVPAVRRDQVVAAYFGEGASRPGPGRVAT